MVRINRQIYPVENFNRKSSKSVCICTLFFTISQKIILDLVIDKQLIYTFSYIANVYGIKYAYLYSADHSSNYRNCRIT